MHKDKRALVETLRHYKRHILGPLFTEAADTIEELLAEKEERETPAYWILQDDEPNKLDPYGVFRKKFVCSACGNWHTYGKTKRCPNCGKIMLNQPPEAHDCHNCKHKDREDVRECQKCLDAGDFPLWEDE